MNFPFAPKVVYGGITFAFQNTSGMWTPDKMTQGGSSESAAGVPETWVMRKDAHLSLSLRFHESEWPQVSAWVDWCLDMGSAGSFLFFPDQNASANYLSWLLKPKVGENWGPTRISGYPQGFELPVVFRTTLMNHLYDIRLTADQLL